MPEITIPYPNISLSGKKTYAVGIAMIAYGAFLWYSGQPETGQRLILEGLGFCGVRAAITKSGPEPVVKEVSDLVKEAIQMQPPCPPYTMTATPPPTESPPAG